MQTKNLIQTQANVIKITGLTKGSVVKKVEDSSYGDNIKYAVVLDIMNDGEKTFLELLEYTKSYNDIKGEIRVYSGDKELALFPTSVEEVKEYFEEATKRIEKDIETDKEDLQKKIASLEKAKEFISGELSKTLLEVSWEEMTQDEYKERKQLKEQKIKELELDLNN